MDETKRRANFRKHHIDFARAVELFQGPTVTTTDDRIGYGETRLLTLGLVDGRVILVVHTQSDFEARIISARKALKHEAQTYWRAAANELGRL